MKIKGYILFTCLLLMNTIVKAQVCTALGQNPSTAFPVCGTTTFIQNTVPLCNSSDLFVPGCSGTGGADYQNKNPYWYKFTCFQSGTLGFLITPNNLGDDYDWQLYDVTGRNPDEVYTNRSLIITGNWAGTFGLTGASSSGVNFIQCASDPSVNLNAFAKMPNLIAGHDYILLISHFTDSQSGYSLSFGGGTANITDPLMPHLSGAVPSCDGTQIRILLNKKITCLSLSADGSEFDINIPGATISNAGSPQCSAGFDLDYVLLNVSPKLIPGNYTLKIKNGTDGNTLVDNCGQLIPEGESLPVNVIPVVPTLLDSINTPGCAPDILQLVFKKGIMCSSIAADGTDFIVSGPSPVSVTSAGGKCIDGTTRKIGVQLSGPLQVGGLYTITLKAGSDGNTLLDECNLITPAASLSFTIKDTVNADFTYAIIYGCQANTVSYSYSSANGVNSWAWNFDNTRISAVQNPIISYTSFSPANTKLTVSNGVCSDTSSATIVFANLLNADFEITSLVCPEDLATLKNTTTGEIITNWTWTFGNGITSTLKDPPPQRFTNPVTATVKQQAVQLIVRNNYGCQDTAIKFIRVINNCFIAVPTAFTPNGDGLNDFLYPINAYKAVNLRFSIYNRFGQQIFSTTDWTNKWDGKYKGQPADAGTYVWVLRFTNTDTNKVVEQKGTSILIR
ncbi:MAG: gliding motility-associated C-terminal domain-containing protein [Ferruginibacter sp.]